VKIVIVGAGSRSFGTGMVADLCLARELRGRGTSVVLVDADPAALDRALRLARLMAERAGTDIAFEAGGDLRGALRGARYVIVAVARRRYELWEQDFRVPLAHGFRQVLGENGGPGALFHALRSLELVIPICRAVEEESPEALVLNFTNPEARVLHAILNLTRVRAVGLCHGVFSAEEAIRRYLDAGPDDIEVTSAGMNHFYCVLRALDRRTGRDRLAEALAKAREDPSAPPLFRKMAEVFGVFTFPSDDHIGEYLSYGTEYHGTKWPYGRECRPVRLGEKPEGSPRDESAAVHEDVTGLLRPSGEIAVPVICDIELDRSSRRSAVNVLNSEGFVSNLPHDAVVEVPAIVDARGVHPIEVGPIPETFAAYMRTQFTIHSLLTEAYRTRSKSLLLQALLLDPCVNSISGAERLLDEMLELQRDFLPTFG